MGIIIAIVDLSNRVKSNSNQTELFTDIEDLLTAELRNYKVIMLNGNSNNSTSILSYEVTCKLWEFVENGGLLFGEMVNCEDFPTSRLFGFKQDFAKTSRRLEKLRIARDNPFCKEGQLLEWNGEFLTGFTFDTEVLVELDVFPETHTSTRKGKYPGIVTKKLGKGRTIYSTFSLFSNKEPWTLRPNWLWNHLIEWLNKEYNLPCDKVKSIIQFEKKSVDHAISESKEWFLNSGIMPELDGSLGVYENVHSIRGTISEDMRPDCNVHTALMFFLLGEYKKDAYWKDVSKNILLFLFESGYQDLDKESSSYGFWKWFEYPSEKPDQIFSDDNGWVAFVLLYLYRRTGIEEYKVRGLLTATSLLKTQNKHGLRPECIREKEITSKGLEYFQYSDEGSMNPHFECIVHAAFLQAFIVSNDVRFLHIAEKGTIHLLNNMDNLKYMYSKTAGYSRFLFSLSQIYSITKKQKYLSGIHAVNSYLKKHQHELGGIEEADNPDPNRYGTEDTGVFRENGEKIADQLYTNNFLIINSWEAWKATRDSQMLEFNDQLVNYISDIQIVSDKKEYRGGWMRSYHLESKEYFGNNGDTGWGAYCLESGWTNAIITTGLLLKELEWSLVD